MRSDDALLLDMLIAARKIVRFSAGMTLDTFEADEMAQSAIIRELQVLGEAARLVSEESKTAYSAIDWRTMTGMRNRLVHVGFLPPHPASHCFHSILLSPSIAYFPFIPSFP